MRIANHGGRAVLLTSDSLGTDIADLSAGRFGPYPAALYDDREAVTRAARGCPSPSPRQVFAVGPNYREHAAESGLALPDGPPPSSRAPCRPRRGGRRVGPPRRRGRRPGPVGTGQPCRSALTRRRPGSGAAVRGRGKMDG